MSAWLCRKITGEYTTRKRTLVPLMALPDRVTTHANCVSCPHDLCSLTPERDHFCFVISRNMFQALFDTGALSLSMAMGLASGLLTGQCAPPSHHCPGPGPGFRVRLPHGWMCTSPSCSLWAHLLSSSQMIKKHTNRITAFQNWKGPQRSPATGVDSEGQGKEEWIAAS